MCEANAYIIKDGKEELFMQNVDKLAPDGDMLLLEDIFGEKKYFKGYIKELALVEHKVILVEN